MAINDADLNTLSAVEDILSNVNFWSSLYRSCVIGNHLTNSISYGIHLIFSSLFDNRLTKKAYKLYSYLCQCGIQIAKSDIIHLFYNLPYDVYDVKQEGYSVKRKNISLDKKIVDFAYHQVGEQRNDSSEYITKKNLWESEHSKLKKAFIYRTITFENNKEKREKNDESKDNISAYRRYLTYEISIGNIDYDACKSVFPEKVHDKECSQFTLSQNSNSHLKPLPQSYVAGHELKTCTRFIEIEKYLKTNVICSLMLLVIQVNKKENNLNQNYLTQVLKLSFQLTIITNKMVDVLINGVKAFGKVKKNIYRLICKILVSEYVICSIALLCNMCLYNIERFDKNNHCIFLQNYKNDDFYCSETITAIKNALFTTSNIVSCFVSPKLRYELLHLKILLKPLEFYGIAFSLKQKCKKNRVIRVKDLISAIISFHEHTSQWDIDVLSQSFHTSMRISTQLSYSKKSHPGYESLSYHNLPKLSFEAISFLDMDRIIIFRLLFPVLVREFLFKLNVDLKRRIKYCDKMGESMEMTRVLLCCSAWITLNMMGTKPAIPLRIGAHVAKNKWKTFPLALSISCSEITSEELTSRGIFLLSTLSLAVACNTVNMQQNAEYLRSDSTGNRLEPAQVVVLFVAATVALDSHLRCCFHNEHQSTKKKEQKMNEFFFSPRWLMRVTIKTLCFLMNEKFQLQLLTASNKARVDYFHGSFKQDACGCQMWPNVSGRCGRPDSLLVLFFDTLLEWKNLTGRFWGEDSLCELTNAVRTLFRDGISTLNELSSSGVGRRILTAMPYELVIKIQSSFLTTPVGKKFDRIENSILNGCYIEGRRLIDNDFKNCTTVTFQTENYNYFKDNGDNELEYGTISQLNDEEFLQILRENVKRSHINESCRRLTTNDAWMVSLKFWEKRYLKTSLNVNYKDSNAFFVTMNAFPEYSIKKKKSKDCYGISENIFNDGQYMSGENVFKGTIAPLQFKHRIINPHAIETALFIIKQMPPKGVFLIAKNEKSTDSQVLRKLSVPIYVKWTSVQLTMAIIVALKATFSPDFFNTLKCSSNQTLHADPLNSFSIKYIRSFALAAEICMSHNRIWSLALRCVYDGIVLVRALPDLPSAERNLHIPSIAQLPRKTIYQNKSSSSTNLSLSKNSENDKLSGDDAVRLYTIGIRAAVKARQKDLAMQLFRALPTELQTSRSYEVDNRNEVDEKQLEGFLAKHNNSIRFSNTSKERKNDNFFVKEDNSFYLPDSPKKNKSSVYSAKKYLQKNETKKEEAIDTFLDFILGSSIKEISKKKQ